MRPPQQHPMQQVRTKTFSQHHVINSNRQENAEPITPDNSLHYQLTFTKQPSIQPRRHKACQDDYGQWVEHIVCVTAKRKDRRKAEEKTRTHSSSINHNRYTLQRCLGSEPHNSNALTYLLRLTFGCHTGERPENEAHELPSVASSFDRVSSASSHGAARCTQTA